MSQYFGSCDWDRDVCACSSGFDIFQMLGHHTLYCTVASAVFINAEFLFILREHYINH
jgi:hypothetical protein